MELINYDTNETITRLATEEQAWDSLAASFRDGGAGVIEVEGERCYVAGPVEIPAKRYEDSDHCLADATRDATERLGVEAWQLRVWWDEQERETIYVERA